MSKEKRVIPVKSKSIRKFFRMYVQLLKPFLGIKPREADILSEFLYFNYKKRNIEDKKDRFKLVFGYDTKVLIQEKLDISGPVLHNAMTALRKKKIIVNNTIPDYLIIEPKGSVDITFSFKIEEHEGLVQATAASTEDN